mgnify:FL=1
MFKSLLPTKVLDALDTIERWVDWCQDKMGLSDYHFKWMMWIDGFIVGAFLVWIF